MNDTLVVNILMSTILISVTPSLLKFLDLPFSGNRYAYNKQSSPPPPVSGPKSGMLLDTLSGVKFYYE